VYRAYIAMCQAEGWPTRYMRQTLGKAVKRVFPCLYAHEKPNRLLEWASLIIMEVASSF
jgi:hypothetical protein